MDSFIKLNAPYWSAGDRYNWTKDLGYRTGYGVDMMKLIGEGKLYVQVKNKVYVIDKELAKETVKHYNSYFKAKQGRKIAVIPACLFIETPYGI